MLIVFALAMATVFAVIFFRRPWTVQAVTDNTMPVAKREDVQKIE